jgi:hypothetical protein
MYVMWTSLILAYGNDKDDLGTALISHLENGDCHEIMVCGGWPYDHPYINPPLSGDAGADAYHYDPATLERRADMIFWTQAELDIVRFGAR